MYEYDCDKRRGCGSGGRIARANDNAPAARYQADATDLVRADRIESRRLSCTVCSTGSDGLPHACNTGAADVGADQLYGSDCAAWNGSGCICGSLASERYFGG